MNRVLLGAADSTTPGTVANCAEIPQVLRVCTCRAVYYLVSRALRHELASLQVGHIVLLVVVQSLSSFRLPSFVSLYEFRQIAGLLCHPHELMLQEFPSRRTLQSRMLVEIDYKMNMGALLLEDLVGDSTRRTPGRAWKNDLPISEGGSSG